jgi:hypothetical protein
MSIPRFSKSITLALLILVSAIARPAAAQTSAALTGTVVDQSGQALPGATVMVTSERTGTLARAVTTDGRGEFRILALAPDTYTVKVEMAGFKTFEKRSNVLNAAAQLSLGTLKLDIGERQELVTVEASGTQVNPEETQHTGLLTATQIEQIQTKARDVMSLLRLVPGVRYEDDGDAMGDSFGKDVPNVGGLRREWNQVTVDGLNGNELGGTSRFASAINLDAIAEVKVLLNSYKAEYGRTGGANIQIISKGGGQRYNGTLYWYGRRDAWNANRWAEKRAGNPRPEQHFDTFGFSLGGPVKIPGLYEPKEKKLFFNYSVEIPEIKRPGTFRRWRMPTELERNGDFSQTLDSAGRLVFIRDPLLVAQGLPCVSPTATNPAGDPRGCFPGNKIPANRINPDVQRVLNLLPLPNAEDPARNFNYTRTERRDDSRANHVLTLDWKPSARDTLRLGLRLWNADQTGDGIPGGTGNAGRWGWFNGLYDYSDDGINFGYTRIFGTNTINEFGMGGRRQTENFLWASQEDQDRMLRATNGWTVGQFNPQLNDVGLMPILRFGGSSSGVENVEFLYPDRQGANAADWFWSARDTLTYTRGKHAFKAGLYLEFLHNNEARGGIWAGNFNFGRTTNNPLDANNGFANGLLGVFQDYQEWDGYGSTRARNWLSEWFAQDTWKASRRLTVDYGVRFLWYTPYWRPDDKLSNFSPAHFDPANAPRIYRPARVNGQNVAQDPLTGQIVNNVYVGTFVPGTGDRANGIVTPATPGMPRGLRKNQGIHPEPRLGLAYDLFGNSRSVGHISAGLFHQARVAGGTIGNLRGAPFTNQGVMFYNTIDNFLVGNTLGNRPQNAEGIELDAQTPSSYKLSMGLTQQLRWGIAADVSYVGNLARHLQMRRYINGVPDGARFLDLHPENRNPQSTGNALAPEFLRPYSGYQRIRIIEHWGTSNYNGLQVQLNRRYSKGLQFGVSYTWSKALGVGDDDPSNYYENRPLKEWYYAPADYDQAHNFLFNFTLDLPKASKLIKGSAVRLLFDGWQLSGDYARVDGDWAGVVLDTTDDFDFTGGDGGTGSDVNDGLRLVRPRLVGDPRLDHANPETGMLNTAAFARPTGRGDYGSVPRNVIRSAGVDNLDLSVFKNFRLGKNRSLQFRVEAYNALNHTQYNRLNLTANFDTNGVQTNSNFGKADQARRLREVQASIRIRF